MTKISALTPLGDDLAVGDQFIIRDISDAGTPNKSVTISGITRGLEVGTALAPSIAFAADKNTGIYGTGSDVLALVTAGENRLHITSGGLVGIGNSSPQSVLNIFAASGGDTSGLRITRTDAGGGDWRIWSSATANGEGAGKLIFGNSANRVIIDGSGNVGIGTTSPHQLLQINSTSVDARLHITNSVTGSTNSDGFQIQVNNSDVYFSNAENGNLVFSSNNTTRFTVDTSGRLSVGTTSAFVDGFNNAFTSSQLSKGSGNNVRCISDTRSVATVNNSTVDAWVGRNAAGTAFNSAMAGHFYVQVGGGDAFSGVYSIVSSSLGTSDATLTAVSTVTRGTSPVSSVQIANDGAGGAIKLTITYINNAGVVNGITSYVSFVGLAG